MEASFLEDLACETARAVYACCSRVGLARPLDVVVGRNPYGDTTLEIDRIAETEARRVIEEAKIPCVFISEESGESIVGEGEPQLVVLLDPIDGSSNAARGMSLYGTSIALARHKAGRLSSDDIVAAAVMNLGTGELFSAARGCGARLNGRRITSSGVTDIHEAILALDASGALGQVDRVLPALRLVRDVRRLGSSALELCYLAAGCVDAFIDFRGDNTILDLGASLLVATEAGAVATQFDGGPIDCILRPVGRLSLLVAGNADLHDELRRCLARQSARGSAEA